MGLFKKRSASASSGEASSKRSRPRRNSEPIENVRWEEMGLDDLQAHYNRLQADHKLKDEQDDERLSNRPTFADDAAANQFMAEYFAAKQQRRDQFRLVAARLREVMKEDLQLHREGAAELRQQRETWNQTLRDRNLAAKNWDPQAFLALIDRRKSHTAICGYNFERWSYKKKGPGAGANVHEVDLQLERLKRMVAAGEPIPRGPLFGKYNTTDDNAFKRNSSTWSYSAAEVRKFFTELERALENYPNLTDG